MLYVHTADRVDLLVGRLASVMAEPPEDPFAPEWLATPTDGLRRWVSLELARHLGAGPGRADGVAANIVRAYPDALRRAVLAADPEGPEDGDDPWEVDRLVWNVLDILAEGTSGPGPGVGGPPPTYAVARRVADLLDRYHRYRPAMVRAWADGNDADGTGRVLADHDRWQPWLWRQVRGRVDVPAPPQRVPGLLGRLAAGDLPLDLPPRLLFFGFSALPAGDFLAVARAAAAVRDVHLFVPEPARYDPAALQRGAPVDAVVGARLRAADTTGDLAVHPLVRSWGRLHRESSVLLAATRDDDVHHERIAGPDGEAATSLLGRVQASIRANRVPPGDFVPAPGDRSVQFHACYGRNRQVEVARDAILHELAAADGTLSEDDIVVVCPAIDRFAPLVEAVFGRPAGPGEDAAAGGDGAPALRYRIADRSLGSSNPVLGAVSALCELVSGRFDTAAVLDFLALPPVRLRFALDEEALDLIADWAEEGNVRVGLDGQQRVSLGIPATIGGNTWGAALDRLLVGSAVSDRTPGLAIGDVVPLGVEGADVDVAARLAEILGALAGVVGLTAGRRSVGEWTGHLRRAARQLFAAPPDASYQVEQLERLLGDLDTAAGGAGRAGRAGGAGRTGGTGGAGGDPLLDFTDMRRALEERFAAVSGRADFFRGGITVTSARPLRWVPYRVVVLLGMDDGALPADHPDGDDLTVGQPFVGDRDARADGREALLETVLAATDRLIVIREGRDVRTNHPVPMAVPVAELHDAVVAEVDVTERDEVADRLELHHPRHGFDERCFASGALLAGTPWGFDAHDLAGAQARRDQVRGSGRPFLVEPLAPADLPVVELDDLRTFFANPAKAFLTRRLGVRLPRREDAVQPVLPTELSALDRWKVADSLLRARARGQSRESWQRIEERLGTLPPPPLTEAALAGVDGDVAAVLTRAAEVGVAPGGGEPVPVDARLPDGTRVVGTVLCHLDGPVRGPVRLEMSRLSPKHKVAAWLELMALVVTEPDEPWAALLVNAQRDAKQPTVLTHLVPTRRPDGAVPPAEALAVAVDCYRRGMREPIPLFPKFSAQRLTRNRPSPGEWRSTRPGGADGDDPAVVLAFDGADYETILNLPPRPDDPGRGRDRLSRFAFHLHLAIARSTDDLGDPKDVTGKPSASASRGPRKADGADRGSRAGRRPATGSAR